MNIFSLGAIILLAVIFLGILIMALMLSFSNAVVVNADRMDKEKKEKKSVNPGSTRGLAIPTSATVENQLKEAMKLAAKDAANLPRGGNMGIGRMVDPEVQPEKKFNSQGVADDPLSAVKIAQFHTWQGLDYQAPKVAASGSGTTTVTQSVKRTLVAGKDFAFTNPVGLSGAEKRQVIIANAKAKSAAYKALKQSGQTMTTQSEAVAQPAAAGTPKQSVPSGVTMPPPPVLIPITDSMSPDDRRKATISNSKAKSAYNKELKALGITAPEEGDAPAAVATPAPVAAAPAPAARNPQLPPPPALIPITDSMSPDERRQATISNSKAKSAYNKELKALGIDPSAD